jgi:hypothetical protein
MNFTNSDLHAFINKASQSTYFGGGEYEKVPERAGFLEMVNAEGDWSYRDSYAGIFRSRGTEVVRYQGNPVWTSAYGGGIVEGKESLVNDTFGFLKRAIAKKPQDEQCFRGPKEFAEGDWRYTYAQSGDVTQFVGHEEIFFQNEQVFIHDIIGGLIVGK